MSVFHEKYFLLCLIVSFVLFSFAFNYSDVNNNQTEYCGIISEINQTNNGFVCSFIDENNNNMSIFTKNKPSLYDCYILTGNYSEDNSIFFVLSMSLVDFDTHK